MKKIAAALFFASLMFAAAPVPAGQGASPEKIAAIESANNAWSDISAEFTQKTHVALIDKDIAKQGLLYLKKGGKIRIEYKGEENKNYISDGTTLWIYNPGDEASLQTYAVNDTTVPKEALSFLGGFGKLRSEFAISNSTSFKFALGGTTALLLTPKPKSEHYSSLEVLFGKDDLIKELIVNNTSGNQSRYTIRNMKINQSLPDDMFTLSSGKATPDTLPK
jgi:chaperone LolA